MSHVTRSRCRRVAFASALLPLLARLVTTAGAQPHATMSGRELYVAACANCHASDGRGASRPQVGFPEPLPDFTDCAAASREAAQDWQTIVARGGPARSFAHRMPAFGDALSADQIARVVDYLRSLCHDRRWPRGELNLPRPIATEKAFPEDEVVVTGSAVSRPGARATDAALIYERRIGAGSQWELEIPVGTRERASGRMTPVQLGDLTAALKHTLYHAADHGTILSGYAEVVLPTGSAAADLGAGTTVVEPGLLFAQTLGPAAFLHAQAGLGVPVDARRAEREALWRAALGTTLQHGGGRSWSPMIELLGARELAPGARSEWDAIPQMQVSLSRRQHVRASVGVRLPLGERDARPRELLGYLNWDWFDGGLFDGWR